MARRPSKLLEERRSATRQKKPEIKRLTERRWIAVLLAIRRLAGFEYVRVPLGKIAREAQTHLTAFRKWERKARAVYKCQEEADG